MSGARRPFTSYAKVQKADPHPGLINLDFDWHPGVDVCWDLSRGLPFADASMRGVFSEHCLEHFPLGRARTLIAEVRRVMRPGAWFRVVVPDLEQGFTRIERVAFRDGHDPALLVDSEQRNQESLYVEALV